jgi:hypothetical protein
LLLGITENKNLSVNSYVFCFPTWKPVKGCERVALELACHLKGKGVSLHFLTDEAGLKETNTEVKNKAEGKKNLSKNED